jgi:hypothetical protein
VNAGELLKRLSKSDPGSAYFFPGAEVHLKQKVIDAIVASSSAAARTASTRR